MALGKKEQFPQIILPPSARNAPIYDDFDEDNVPLNQRLYGLAKRMLHIYKESLLNEINYVGSVEDRDSGIS